MGKVSKEAVAEKVTSKQTPEGGEGGRAVQIGEIAGAKALGKSVPFTQMGRGCGKSIFLFWTCCIEAPSGHRRDSDQEMAEIGKTAVKEEGLLDMQRASGTRVTGSRRVSCEETGCLGREGVTKMLGPALPLSVSCHQWGLGRGGRERSRPGC